MNRLNGKVAAKKEISLKGKLLQDKNHYTLYNNVSPAFTFPHFTALQPVERRKTPKARAQIVTLPFSSRKA
jgi:hypothetical protein